MDRIEQLFRENKATFDRQEPNDGMWNRLKEGLTNSSSATYSRGWLLAAGILFVIILGSIAVWPGAAEDFSQPHQSFPDIVMQGPEGDTRSLSELKGKVVLVEFWASWCNVCSEKNCNDLLPLYDMYKDRGFEIFAVSVDEDHRQWINGIETYHLPWIHVSDLQGFASPVSQRFDVNQTPTTYLLDENRNVIGKNLTKKDLAGKLMECYGG